jgi:hypothetical protein
VIVAFIRAVDAHFRSGFTLLHRVKHEPALQLSPDAARGRRGKHALRSPSDAHLDVHIGRLRLGGVDAPRDIAIGNEAHRRTDTAYRRDQTGMPRSIENDRP